MGRMIWATAACLLLTVLLCWAGRREIDCITQEITRHTQTALACAQSDRPRDALSHLHSARELWHTHAPALHMLISHDKTEAAAQAMDRCEYALLSEDRLLFSYTCRDLCRLMADLAEAERLTWANLL